MHKTLKAMILLTNLTPVNLILKNTWAKTNKTATTIWFMFFNLFNFYFVYFFPRKSYSSHRIDSVHFLLSLNLHISHLIIISWSAIFQNLDFWYTSLSMFLGIAPTLYPFCCGISECLFSFNMIYKTTYFSC